MNTFSRPPSTPTAPAAAPIERSMTHPGMLRPLVRLQRVRVYLEADCSVGLPLASLVPACSVCCSGKDFLAASRASARSSVCSFKSC